MLVGFVAALTFLIATDKMLIKTFATSFTSDLPSALLRNPANQKSSLSFQHLMPFQNRLIIQA